MPGLEAWMDYPRSMCHPSNLSDLAELDEALQRTHQQPLLLFKHSLYCDRSVMAYHELMRLCRGLSGVSVAVMTVQTARQLCDEVSRRFGVEHHTPQVLMVVDGAVTWHARHFQVTADAMRNALATGIEPSPCEAEPQVVDAITTTRCVRLR